MKIVSSFGFLVVALGIISIYTDVSHKKIKNIHLLIITFAAFCLYGLFLSKGTLTFSWSLILNPVIAFGIGFIFYRSGIWKAGDGKLFAVYALLLPVNHYAKILPLSCLALLLNTFSIALIYIIAVSAQDIINNHKGIFKATTSPKTIAFLGKTLLITLGISWILLPIFNLLPIHNNVFLHFAVLYIGYRLVYKFFSQISNLFIFIGIATLGSLLRYYFMPESFHLKSLLHHTGVIILFSLLFSLLNTIIEIAVTKKQRILLSPFLSVSTLLSMSNFLWLLLKLALKCRP